MAVLLLSDSGDPPSVAQIEIKIDRAHSKVVKWRSRSLGAFRDSLGSMDWQTGFVQYSKYNDEEWGATINCTLDASNDGCPMSCFRLDGTFRYWLTFTTTRARARSSTPAVASFPPVP